MVKSYLEYLYKNYRCKLFPPEKEEIFNDYLPNTEYNQLLQISNGLICNGIEIFGCTPIIRPNKGYTMPDTKSITERFMRYNFFKNKIIIGQMPETLIYYNLQNKTYGLSDRISFYPLQEYESLIILLKNFL